MRLVRFGLLLSYLFGRGVFSLNPWLVGCQRLVLVGERRVVVVSRWTRSICRIGTSVWLLNRAERGE